MDRFNLSPCHAPCAKGLRAPPFAALGKALVSDYFDRSAARRDALLLARAREMLVAPSPSEEKLWREIRGKRLGVAFRRQVVIGDFIVDFLAPSRKLVVEVDGVFHERQRSADARRDAKLGRLGYRVLRIPSSLLDRDLSEALARIREAIG